MVKVLSRDNIVKRGRDLIEPFDEECLTPVGYDLRVGRKVVNFRTTEEVILSKSASIVIPPGDRFAVESLEKVKLTNALFAFVFTKVSMLWNGLTSLGTKIDPAFSDYMWLIFANDSNRPYTLRYEDKICNVMFFEYENAPEIKERSRPPFLAVPPMLPGISDSDTEKEIQTNFGHGVSSVVSYFRPQIEKHSRKLRRLEKFRNRINYIVIAISISVIAGVIVWLLTHGTG